MLLSVTRLQNGYKINCKQNNQRASITVGICDILGVITIWLIMGLVSLPYTGIYLKVGIPNLWRPISTKVISLDPTACVYPIKYSSVAIQGIPSIWKDEFIIDSTTSFLHGRNFHHGVDHKRTSGCWWASMVIQGTAFICS